MTRRTFSSVVLGFLGLACVKSKPPQGYHYFLSSEECFIETDDPQWAYDRLEIGPQNVTTCNGLEIPHVREFFTGPSGWVKYVVQDGDGEFVEWPSGRLKENVVFGLVEYRVDHGRVQLEKDYLTSLHRYLTLYGVD